jgi:hypothetical protein
LELTLKLAELAVAHAPTRSGISEIQHLADQAAGSGLKYTSLEASLSATEGMIKTRNYTDARRALENLLASSEKLGARSLQARSHLLMGTVLRLTGKSADAGPEYRQAVQIIEEMQKDAGAKFTERSDIKPMLAEARRWAPQS